jgi:hypothetical protein
MIGAARHFGLAAAVLCVASAIAFAPTLGEAGAWTEPQGQGLMIATFWGWTGAGAPWGGDPAVKQNRADLQIYAEYGLNDQWTIFGQMAIERYQISPPTSSLYSGLDYSDLGFRAKLWASGPWIVSGEATLMLPGAWNPVSPAQAGNTGGAADWRMLGGYSFAIGSAPGFVDLEFGYRVRTAGPPDEWHLDATIGVKPTPGMILMLQDFFVVSMPSTDPSFSAWRQNVVEASLVLPLWDRWQAQVGWFTTTLAAKTNTERGAELALWRTF